MDINDHWHEDSQRGVSNLPAIIVGLIIIAIGLSGYLFY